MSYLQSPSTTSRLHEGRANAYFEGLRWSGFQLDSFIHGTIQTTVDEGHLLVTIRLVGKTSRHAAIFVDMWNSTHKESKHRSRSTESALCVVNYNV